MDQIEIAEMKSHETKIHKRKKKYICVFYFLT